MSADNVTPIRNAGAIGRAAEACKRLAMELRMGSEVTDDYEFWTQFSTKLEAIRRLIERGTPPSFPSVETAALRGRIPFAQAVVAVLDRCSNDPVSWVGTEAELSELLDEVSRVLEATAIEN